MSRKKKPTFIVQPFESVICGETTGKEPFTRVFESMYMSENWLKLTGRQRALYLFCKAQYTPPVVRGKAVEGTPYADHTDIEAYKRPEVFYMNLGKVKECRLYNRKDIEKVNMHTFYADMKALQDGGFIECLEIGRLTRTKSIYTMSEKWKNSIKTRK